jgi:regulator of sigma E protease
MFFTLLAFLVALGILITFHELGHYWAARACGVKVLTFSVGFGKPFLKRTDKHGTIWALAAIPLGGFVKMLDDPTPDMLPEQRKQAFSCQPVSRRFFVVAAGPIFNLILAAFLYACLNFSGTLEPAPILAKPAVNSPAAAAGLQANDRIVSIDGEPIQGWQNVRWLLLQKTPEGGQVDLKVERASGQVERVLNMPRLVDPGEQDILANLGLGLQMGKPSIGSVNTNEPAEKAGFMPGDVVQVMAGQSNPSVTSFIDFIKKHPDQPVNVTVLRGSQVVNLTVTPSAQLNAEGESVGRIGVALQSDIPTVMVSHGVFESIWLGITRTFDTAWFSVKMMGRMITGDVSLKNISGPVTIADYAGQTARIGFASYIAFLALVSVSIGVLNLLPIPMLDGGHLVFYIFEMIRGKPAPDSWLATSQRVGVALLGGLMTLAIFNDFSRLFS